MPELAKIQRTIQALAKSDDALRREAIQFLKELDEHEWSAVPRKVVPTLVESLQQLLVTEKKLPPLRHDILAVLGKIGPLAAPAIPQLIELLADGNADGIREAAAAALGRMGRDARAALDPLIEILPRCRPTLAVQVIRSIAAIDCEDERTRTALTDLWYSPALPQNTQVQVAIALCQLGLDFGGVVKFLIGTATGNPEAPMRRATVAALACCNRNETDVVPALMRAAAIDKDEEVRRCADASLTSLRLTRAKAAQICAKQLAVSAHAESALKHGGEAAVPALIEALATHDVAIREKAARILGCLGEVGRPAIPALTHALRDKDLTLRLAAAKSLWNITQDAALVTPVLVSLLGETWPAGPDADESRRRYLQTVMEALWRIGPPAEAAVPALLAKCKDKNRLISESAQSALRVIAPAAANKVR
jgi:HEAT repeat protein